jgi:two-component system, NtrC family, response regulator AlgB
MNILVVDDETNIRKTLALCLESDGHKVVAVSNPADARAEASRRVFDMAFVDLRLGAEKGLELIPKLLAESPWIKIVVITAYASVDTAVQSMKIGSTDYLPKPFTPAQVKHAAQRIAQTRVLEQKVATLQDTLGRVSPETDLTLTTHPVMQRALHLARQVAATDATVMIRGETGTGKTALARAIHGWSPRAEKPLCVVSCPAYADGSIDLELFGRADPLGGEQAGRIALAEGGTLLLDEIGDLPLSIQPKLLRFVQDRQYEPVGRCGTRQADLRVIASTNTDLGDLVQNGKFREDLLYRLNVIQIELPPLRDRPDDVLPLAESFVAFFTSRSLPRALAFSPAAAGMLCRHTWPGNIHELRNVVERCVILADGDTIGPEHLPATMTARPVEPAGPGAMVSLDQLEEMHIRRVLAATKSLEEAAGILGIDTATLWRRRKKYGI